MKYFSISTEIKDSNGEPMIFAIDENYVLSVTMRTENREVGWVRYDLTAASGKLKAQVFGVSQNFRGEIYLVLAAGQAPLGSSQLFRTSALPNNPADPIWQNLRNRWIPMRIDPSPTRITEIILDAPQEDGEVPLILVGTTEKIGKVPKYLRIKPEVVDDNVEPFPKLPNADELLDIKAGRPDYGRGVYVLYRTGNNIVLEFDGLPDPEFNVPVGATLTTPSGAMALQTKVNELGFTDLYVIGNGKFLFSSDNQRAYAHAEKIADDATTLNKSITSRSSLTEDYQVKPPSLKLEPYPVYRTSVTLPPMTCKVDLWASEEVEVEINGKKYTVDPVMPARVKPSAISKLLVSIPARELGCPTLTLRTNLMRPEQRHVICPDVEAHKKIVELKDGALYEAREQLGIHSEFSKEHIDHVQKALQNIARTVQYTYNKKPHGVHHDRAVLPKNMDDPHFILDFSEGKAHYKALNKAEVTMHIAGARMLQGQAAQSFWDDIGNFFKKAGSIIVHTVENIGRNIVDTFEHIKEDFVNTVHKIGEDLVHGDISHIFQDLMQGGEHAGRDLFKGAANIAENLVSGAGQLVVVTLKLAGEAVQFVLHHTGYVGKALGWLLEKIGVGLHKAIDWFLDKIGWHDVLHTHDVLIDTFNTEIETMKTYPKQLKQKADNFFSHLTSQISQDMDKALNDLDMVKIGKRPQPVSSHSGAVEKMEWLLGKFSENHAKTTTLTTPTLSADHSDLASNFVNVIEQQLGKDKAEVLDALQDSFNYIEKIFSDANHTPEYLLGAILEFVKAVAILSLNTIKVILDALLDLFVAMLQGFKEMMTAPWDIPFISDLYRLITEGRQLNFLSFTCLLLAIPVTLIHKAEFKTIPFETQTIKASLAELPSNVRSWGIVYGVCQIVLMPIAIVTDAKIAFDAMGGSKGSDIDRGFGSQLTALDLGISAFALIAGNPIPPGEPYLIPLDHAKEDVFEAPSYWGHIIWWFELAGWGVNAFASGTIARAEYKKVPQKKVVIAGDLLSVFNTLWGITHMGLMATLDVADRNKADALKTLDGTFWSSLPDRELAEQLEQTAVKSKGHQPYWNFSRMSDEEVSKWVADIRNYHEWAKNGSVDGGIPRKTYGNIMTTFPEIGKLGTVSKVAEGTEFISLAVTAFFDSFGYLGEGITYVVRTERNELL
ncbi:MAG: hypothetical protein RID53_19070 [Coleofasciculus sp. B1-GNL1-01]|uniref:hypothetical protein n=1 Tax=Coleofasciculus sp. B1-GNL1-01 TaxID=3068484 RepID=UPI0033050BFD